MSSPERAAPVSEFGRAIRLMGPAQRGVMLVGLPVLALVGVQFVTQSLVLALNGNRDFDSLGLFRYIGQWGQAQPATQYGEPGSNVLHWVIVAALLAVVLTIAALGMVWSVRRRRNPQLRPGLASEKEIRRELSEKQLVQKRGPHLRPSLKGRAILPEQVGYPMGTFRSLPIWLRTEDPMIVVGPSRSGKGWRLLLRWILSAPGAVVTTSVRLDNAKLTIRARERAGSPTRVWAPGIEGGKEVGRILRWNPVAGCLDEETLVRRINALIPSGSFAGSTSNGGHWDALGRQLASHLFHAAACGDRTVDDIWGWVASPKRAEEAVRLIRQHPAGMHEHADHLEYVLGMPHEQRATSWGVLPTVLAFMESRAAREWMKPEEGESVDLVDFILRNGTLYIVGDKMASPVYVRMNDALLAEIDFISKGLAAASPGSRLDPPITYVLDEAGNIEYQGMYELITAGGGYGRVAIAAFQAKSQLDQFGDQSTGATLWDAAVAKIILPGGGDPKALSEVSDLIGEVWFERESHSIGSGDPSASYSTESRAAFTQKDIRQLGQKYAFLFYRNLPPVVVETMPFNENPRFNECMADAAALDTRFQGNSRYADYFNRDDA